MRPTHQKITIIDTQRTNSQDLNEQLQWFGTSLGLFNLRDKDKSRYRIFIEIMKATKSQRDITSEELAQRLSLTRGTIVHHLNKLMEAGIVISVRNRYTMRVTNLTSVIEELEKDMQRIFQDLKSAARELDSRLGL